MKLIRVALIALPAILLGACHHHVMKQHTDHHHYVMKQHTGHHHHMTKQPTGPIMTSFDEGYYDGCASSKMYVHEAVKKDYPRARTDSAYYHGWDAGFTDCGFTTPRKYKKYAD